MSGTRSIQTLTVGDVLREHARSRPHVVAVVDGSTRLTYLELDERVNRLCAALSDVGLHAGGTILWLGQNSHRVLELLLAAAKLGARLCPANWRSSAEEFEFVLDDLDPEVVVWQEADVGAVVGPLVGRGRAAWIRHDGDATDDYEGRLAGAAAADRHLDVDPSSGLLVLYTAAFEGRPNGAVLDHHALLVQGLTIALAARVDDTYVFLNCGPLFHIATWMWSLPTFLLGGANVYVRRVDAEEICAVIEAERCTGAFLMPPTMDQMVEVNAGGRYDLSSLRAPARSDAWNAMVTVDPSPLGARRGGYGQSEASGLAVLAAFSATGQGPAGRPAPLVAMRVVDPDGNELPPGEVGEITLRGPTVMRGYHNRPDVNAARSRGGWHHTNDLGRREPDGSLTFVGPKTRIVKSAAENIYPAEVEGCLKSHPAVVDCAVIGVPDEKWGQRVKAVVVRREPIEPDALVEHCRERIASYKKPSIVEFVDALPRVNGLLDYDAIDAAHGGGGYPGHGTQGGKR